VITIKRTHTPRTVVCAALSYYFILQLRVKKKKRVVAGGGGGAGVAAPSSLQPVTGAGLIPYLEL